MWSDWEKFHLIKVWTSESDHLSRSPIGFSRRKWNEMKWEILHTNNSQLPETRSGVVCAADFSNDAFLLTPACSQLATFSLTISHICKTMWKVIWLQYVEVWDWMVQSPDSDIQLLMHMLMWDTNGAKDKTCTNTQKNVGSHECNVLYVCVASFQHLV